MKAFELIDLIKSATGEHGTAGSDIMIIDQDMGELFVPQSVVAEHHDDGSWTIWLRAEAF